MTITGAKTLKEITFQGIETQTLQNPDALDLLLRLGRGGIPRRTWSVSG